MSLYRAYLIDPVLDSSIGVPYGALGYQTVRSVDSGNYPVHILAVELYPMLDLLCVCNTLYYTMS